MKITCNSAPQKAGIMHGQFPDTHTASFPAVLSRLLSLSSHLERRYQANDQEKRNELCQCAFGCLFFIAFLFQGFLSFSGLEKTFWCFVYESVRHVSLSQNSEHKSRRSRSEDQKTFGPEYLKIERTISRSHPSSIKAERKIEIRLLCSRIIDAVLLKNFTRGSFHVQEYTLTALLLFNTRYLVDHHQHHHQHQH